jgi:hypothetical protein
VKEVLRHTFDVLAESDLTELWLKLRARKDRMARKTKKA